MPIPEWEEMLKGVDFTPLNGQPPVDTTPKLTNKMVGRRVFVQKIITEVWVYTDVEGKAFGHQGIQDIVIVGDMDFEEALKLVGQSKEKRRKRA